MVIVTFALLAAMQAPAATAVEGAPAQPSSARRERLICRRETVLGSMVKAKRTCLTATEWRLAHKLGKDTVDEWQSAIDGARRAN